MKEYDEPYKKFKSMISHDRFELNYFTGKEIKEVVAKCIKLEMAILVELAQHCAFYDKYVASEYPLSDDALYSISNIVRDDKPELICYKKKDGES